MPTLSITDVVAGTTIDETDLNTPWGQIEAVVNALDDSNVPSLSLSPNRIKQSGATTGQALVWNGSAWAPATLGRILAYARYATSSTKTTSSTSYVDADSTNLKVTFTAPASGSVVVRLRARGYQTTGGNGYWNLREGAADVAGTDCFVTSSTTITAPSERLCQVTGLTSGTSYTYKWGFKTSANSTNIQIDTDAPGAVNPAAWMIVYGVGG